MVKLLLSKTTVLTAAISKLRWAAGYCERLWIFGAVGRIAGEQRAEDHQFAGQEDPHSVGPSLMLLLQCVEVRSQRGIASLTRSSSRNEYSYATCCHDRRVIEVFCWRRRTVFAIRVPWRPTGLAQRACRTAMTKSNTPVAERIPQPELKHRRRTSHSALETWADNDGTRRGIPK